MRNRHLTSCKQTHPTSLNGAWTQTQIRPFILSALGWKFTSFRCDQVIPFIPAIFSFSGKFEKHWRFLCSVTPLSLISRSLLAQGHELQGFRDCQGQKKRSLDVCHSAGEQDHSSGSFWRQLQIKTLHWERAYKKCCRVNKMLEFLKKKKKSTGQAESLDRDIDAWGQTHGGDKRQHGLCA